MGYTNVSEELLNDVERYAIIVASTGNISDSEQPDRVRKSRENIGETSTLSHEIVTQWYGGGNRPGEEWLDTCTYCMHVQLTQVPHVALNMPDCKASHIPTTNNPTHVIIPHKRLCSGIYTISITALVHKRLKFNIYV